ncbi:MAG TPA: nucleoside-diphosphate sugar epimerase/dehydratase, partial [Steroidobacteraceae bacterium]|nr:nucleoside-diphosphate sugar epimerase/dehydratase [Steroidobacteraceae bacterium]
MAPVWTQRIAKPLLELPRRQKRVLMLAADLVCIPAALWTAITLKSGTAAHSITDDGWLYLAALLATVPVFARLGLYRAVLRFMGPKALTAVVVGVTLSVILLLLVNYFALGARIQISTFVIYWALALIYVGGSRLVVRSVVHYQRHGANRVAIYGAGAAGAQVADALVRSGRYYPVAFVDDNKGLHGSIINGIEVFSPEDIPQLIEQDGLSTVLLALPSLSRRRRHEILQVLEPLEVHVQTVPDIDDIVNGNARVEDIRDVDVNDLLGRDPVPPDEQLLDACIRGKIVMVTGAGGSIGSELCRQIIRLGPTRLLLFEMSELGLYNIEKELRLLKERLVLDVDVVPLLGNAHHKYRVREVVQSYGVQTIYHAAAYKHVPIVEQNVIEGVHNNVFSTWYAAEAALECRVETFVLISTDKAVNPTNVMGATKRLAEIVLQGLHERGSGTRFCMVRFGNVLESSGSVVPLFREQIRKGGPVTVTHPDVIRYFMTIPEAAQLVLQAGSMAKGGDVFVLDMGKPVRIEDLARRMINLMGLTVRDVVHPDGDIEIVYTGLRPAEKLFEELLIGNNVTGTEHSMIMR